MDFPTSLKNSEFPWANTVIYAALGQTVLEYYLNNRQLRHLHRSENSSTDGTTKGISTAQYHTFKAFYRLLQVLAIIYFDGIFKIWTIAVNVQETYLGGMYDSDWGRSYLFLIACYFIYPILHIPLFLYRVCSSGESVKSFFVTSRRKRNSWSPSIAEGRPVTMVLFLFIFTALYFKIFEKQINQTIVFWTAGFQITYSLLYPMLSQPRGKHLTPMEDGETRHAIHELATIAKFPIKEIHVTEGALDRVHTGVQAWGWPRKTYITVHKETLDQCTTSDITAFLAQELGAWKLSNGIRLFAVGQVFFANTVTFLLMFLKEGSVYTSFGFNDSYPLVAGLLLFAIGVAPPLAAFYKLQINSLRRNNQFFADKHAAELGYLHDLCLALSKVEHGKTEVDKWYSYYYNAVPLVSERIKALEVIEEKQDGEKKGAISL